MNREFRQRLKNELQADIEPCAAHMERTIMLAHTAYDGRRRFRHVSTLSMIARQFRFVARPVWLLQGVALILLCMLMYIVRSSEGFVSKLPALLSVSSVFVAMTVLPIFGRARRYKMYEIESSTRLSHQKLMFAKLCAVGSGDAICLVIITILNLGEMVSPTQTVLTFILLPFLLSCTGSLFVLNRSKEEYGVYVSTGLCIAIGGTYWSMAARLSCLPAQSLTGLTVTACTALLIFLAFECRSLMKQIPSSDMREALLF